MVGIVLRSAKLMELTGLFSGKAQSLLGKGSGFLAFKASGALSGGSTPITGSRLRTSCTGPWAFLSRYPVLRRAPHALKSQKIQQSTIPGLEVKQTFGYLKIMDQFEELSFEGS